MITLTKFRIFVDKLNKDNSRKYKMSVLEEYNTPYSLHDFNI